jgi:hypothetical protein
MDKATFYNRANQIECDIRIGLPFNRVNLEVWVLDGYVQESIFRKLRVIELAKMIEVKYNEKIIK